MIELARHIEILLLTNNCVIVPGLGGFITHHVSSKIATDGSILPPRRTVGFNPQLTINDGLLVQSYMLSYDANYPEASRIVETKVDELLESLRIKGSLSLHDIGTLRMNIHGNLEFTPIEAGTLTPSLFGLYSFQFKRLSELAPVKEEENTEAQKVTNNDVQESNTPHITIRIKRRVLRNVAATAAAVALFFCMSTPVENTYVGNPNKAGIESPNLFCHIENESYITSAAHDSYILDAKEVKKLNSKSEAKAETAVKSEIKVSKNEAPKEVHKVSVAEEKSADKGRYCIVLASAVGKKNAEEYVERLAKQHIDNPRICEGKMRRVVCMNFHSEESAQKKLNELRRENKEFKDAWVYFEK